MDIVAGFHPQAYWNNVNGGMGEDDGTQRMLNSNGSHQHQGS
ncbi:MAG: hypothetical protein M2R45_04483 [Verrucomicrobia subdivision 3 bacterium]|nr:hypothetical protein [Limisphaerales bacterium]MCS1412673.1 hypothetical protein [Limisphaerales bacterium]